MPEYSSDNQYSRWVGLVYIFNLIVGTGALTLPAVFAKAGWILGLSVILILAFISFITVTFVIEAMASANAIVVHQLVEERKLQRGEHQDELESFHSDSEDTPLVGSTSSSINQSEKIDLYYTIEDKIEMGKMASLFFNNSGTTIFYLCFAVYLYGDLSIYGAAVAKSLADVSCTYLPKNLSCNDTIPVDELCWAGSSLSRIDAYRIFLSIFVISLGPFVWFDVQKTKYLQLLTSVMRWLAFSIMIIYAIHKLIIDGPQGNPRMGNVSGIPSLFGACVYSFMCHHSLPALVAPIANKTTLNRFLALDYIFIASFYLLLALTAAFAFQHVDDLYTLDFGPRESGDCSNHNNIPALMIEYFLALFPVFTLSASFPIIAITLKNNLQSLFFNEDMLQNLSFRKFVFPGIVLLPPYLIAMSTEDLTLLVGFTGSYAGVCIQYLIPTFLVYYARQKTNQVIGSSMPNKFASPFIHKYWLHFVVLWAITCMIFVTLNLLEKIIYRNGY